MARLAVGTGMAGRPAVPLPAPSARSAWGAGAPRSPGLRLAWRVAERSGRGAPMRWGAAAGRSVSDRAGWVRGGALPAAVLRCVWSFGARRGGAVRVPWGVCVALPGRPVRMLWPFGTRTGDGSRLPWQPAVGLDTPGARGRWASATAVADSVRLPWSRHFLPLAPSVRGAWDFEPDTPPPPPAHVVPLRLVYAMYCDATVTRLPSGDPVEVGSLTLTEDADGVDIDVSLEVLGRASLDLVAPDSTGPAVLQASLNGLPWRFIAEDWDCTEEHGTLTVARVRGRSLSALLGSPFSPARDYTESAARSVAQLADQELPPAGWSLDWRAQDWSVPAGAWSYQGLSPAQAIARCADAAGAIVVPGRAAQTLTVQPRYPVLPWDWPTATPDYDVPREVLLSATGRYPVPEQANGVYIHGGPVGGVLAWARRTGSAGDRLAATVEDALLTDTAGAQARAARILAGQAQQPALSAIVLPLGGPDFPPARLGHLFRISGSTGQPDVLGIATSITITCQRDQRGALRIEQTIGLGERTPNLWAAWQRLLPTDPRRVGTITTDHGDGTVSVSLPTGGTLRVLGSGTAGAKVYTRSGRIEGPAPDLPTFVLDV